MRPLVVTLSRTLFLLGIMVSAANAQTETLLYDHVHMTVPDPQAAASWYQEHIGGELIDGRDDRVLVGTTRIMFLQGEGRQPSMGSAVDHLGFSFADLDAKVRELADAGATVTTEPREVEGLFRLAFVNDPWGTRLELVQDPQHLGFHHLHLRAPDPEATFAWYQEQFGGVRLRMRGRLDGILYPGNVWLLISRGEATPTREGTIDHIGWRALDLAAKIEELRRKGVTIETEPRDMTLPNGPISFAYVTGPDGARVELVQRAGDMR
jgi:lactoylglutathione lyase